MPRPLSRFLSLLCRPALLALLLVSVAAPAGAGMPAGDPANYVIKRDGKPIGTLKIDFRRDGKTLVAKSHYTIQIKLLAIVLYRYDKHMTETYEDGQLVAYETDIDDNGTKTSVRVTRDGERLSIVHPKGRLTAPLGLYPSTYWPAATPTLTRMIDSSDGILIDVKTTEVATANLAIDGRTVDAKRYAMTGDLERDIWYAAESGEWLKLKMKASDDSTIEIERDWDPVWKAGLL